MFHKNHLRERYHRERSMPPRWQPQNQSNHKTQRAQNASTTTKKRHRMNSIHHHHQNTRSPAAFVGNKILVQQAGIHGVNGVYTLTSQHEGAGRYTKAGPWSGKNREFCIFRSLKKWIVGVVADGGAKPVHLYKAVSEKNHPPPTGWTPCKGRGPSTPPVMGWAQQAQQAAWTQQEVAPQQQDTTRTREMNHHPICQQESIYKNILFSKPFSDVAFSCADGATVRAHQRILAAASPYFKMAFADPANAQRESLLINATMHSSAIIKSMLAFLYTGKVDKALLQREPVAFLSVASDYHVQRLKGMAELCCVRSYLNNAANFKFLWQTGVKYQSGVLKKACVAYAKHNPLGILRHVLAEEDAPLWQEFSKGLMMEETEQTGDVIKAGQENGFPGHNNQTVVPSRPSQ